MSRHRGNIRAMAQLQDAWTESNQVAATVRQRLFATAPTHRQGRSKNKVVWIATGCTAIGLAAGLALLWMPTKSTLTFSVAEGQGALGKWVSASAEQVLPLDFSDGTRIVLQPLAQARVVALQARGAHVVLERGSLGAAVQHRPNTRWELQAGPFAIMVRGTRFNLGWSPETSTFALELTEGLVEVSGPGLNEPRAVKSGQSLRVSSDAGRWRVDSSSVGTSIEAAEPTRVAGEVAASNDQTMAPVSSASSAASIGVVAPSPNWQQLAAAGNYADALGMARKQGLQLILSNGSVADLTKLAQVARFAGDPESARSALRAVRERFAGSAEAAMATFDLGRLAFDTSGRYLEAAHWFKDYLREFPHGILAREAMGRLIEALERGGDHSAARGAANEYLLRFPSGPHVGLAHRVLNR
jgi:transmembrane sensor